MYHHACDFLFSKFKPTLELVDIDFEDPPH